MLSYLLLLALQGPGFSSQLWPGEGIPHFTSTVDTLAIFEQPSQSASKRRVAVTRGESIAFDDTRFITVGTGRIATLASGTFSGRSFGNITYLSKDLYYKPLPSHEIPFTVGDTLEYLQPRAEGECILRVDGAVIAADHCPAFNPRDFRVLDEPRVEWWVHATIAGSSAAWLLVDGKKVREGKRSF